MCNKDFLRQIISGEKGLVAMTDLRIADVPNYDGKA